MRHNWIGHSNLLKTTCWLFCQTIKCGKTSCGSSVSYRSMRLKWMTVFLMWYIYGILHIWDGRWTWQF